MNFSLDDDHLMLRDAAATFLRQEVDLATLLVPGATAEQAGGVRLWTKIAELGWLGAIVPEAYGGLGLTTIDLAMIVGECGRFLAPAPLFGTLAGTWALLAAGSEGQKQRWLPAVSAGSMRLALAIAARDGSTEGANEDIEVVEAGPGYLLSGNAYYVVDGASADAMVVAAIHGGRRRFFVVERASVEVKRLDWRDITREVCSLTLDRAPAELLGGDRDDAWPWIRDRLLLVLAAESAGGLHAVLDDTVAYAKERVAFGRTIGQYQAIKHQLADMLAQAECASTAVLYAAWALSESAAAAPLAAAMAHSHASDAYRDATHRSIQIFGAIGFTWEMKNHLYFKRARANAELLGSPAAQRERIVRLLEERARHH
ncbi:MAG: acyl-CoA/acyl-ACP dehydrogenase [Burkholderiaceae bacterium]|nr:acyl-CoA/acyl-ACP dehydrogenase [Burkholderiaceae bacterium]